MAQKKITEINLKFEIFVEEEFKKNDKLGYNYE